MKLLRLAIILWICNQTGAVFGQDIYPPLKLTILHTNDHHGRFWKNKNNEYGLAARKTLIDNIRSEVTAQGGYTLLLDAGDVNTGTPESDLQNAEPDFRGMSYIGYDAMAVGNHEFDKTPQTQLRQQHEWSNFPWLSANIYKAGQRVFEAYRLFQFAHVKVAVMGLTTDDTNKLIDRAKFPDIAIRAPETEAQDLLPQLRPQADILIALTHMGHYVDGKHGVNSPGDVELARSVKGIDLVVGGHSHHPVCMSEQNQRNEAYVPGDSCMPDYQNGTWIVQAAEWGKFVGRADFEFSHDGLKLIRYQLIPVNLTMPVSEKPLTTITEDPEMLKLLLPFQQNAISGMEKIVGRSNGKFDGERKNIRNKATNLGILITSAMRERMHADLAMISSGGIRDSLPAGDISYRDIVKVLPFKNHLQVIQMQGDDLESYLHQILRMTPGSGAFPQMQGVQIDSDGNQVKSLLINGKPIIKDKVYRLATSSFNAKGGDGYPVLSDHPGIVSSDYIDADVLSDFISSRPLLRTEDFVPEQNKNTE